MTTVIDDGPGRPRPAVRGAAATVAAPSVAIPLAVVLLTAALLAGCGADDGGGTGSVAEPGDSPAAAGWSLTAWGAGYEVFPEAGPLAAGATTEVAIHVTVLDGFSPLERGRVTVVLRDDGDDGDGGDGGGGREERFSATAPRRPGVWVVEVTPAAAGERELLFRVDGPVDTGEIRGEEIRGGRVRVGTAGDPGGLRVAPAPKGGTAGGEPVPFLKEEQWRSDFATAWVRRGALPRALSGPARLRPAAGGAVTLTAPLAAVVRPTPWPFPGRRVGRGETVMRLVPRLEGGRSLAELEAEVTARAEELATARARLGRLEELWPLEAVSRREVEEARTRVAVLEARSAAARRDLESARGARGAADGKGGESAEGAADGFPLRAPFAATVAAVATSPGEAVAAGDALVELVRTDPAWVEVALEPAEAARLGDDAGDEAGGGGPGVRGLVLSPPGVPPVTLPADRVRWISTAPRTDPATGLVTVLLEVTGGGAGAGAGPVAGLPLGATARAEVLLAEAEEGVVVPTSALVDDGGEPVVYLQLAGERFIRQPVRVLVRRGERALVDGLVPGQRLVTRGGPAIRRSVLLSGGASHGHVH